MAATPTTLANLIRPVVETDPTIIKWSNKVFLRTMAEAYALTGESRPFEYKSRAGSTLQWNVNRGTGNSSTQIFTDATPTPAAGEQTWARASLSWIGFRTIIQAQGSVFDDLGSPEARFHEGADMNEEGVYGELPGALDDLADLINVTFEGSANNGILAAIDDGTSIATYAGLSRLTLADWQSAVTPVGGALTLAAISDLKEELSDNDIGARPNAWWGPENQITNYARLVGPEAATSLVRFNAPMAGGPAALDGGFNSATLTIHGAPFYGVPDFTDTVICATHMQDWAVVNHRMLQRKPLPAEGDIRFREQVSTRLSLVCFAPRRQGALQTLTA